MDCISWLEMVPRAMSPATRRRPTTSELEVQNREKNEELGVMYLLSRVMLLAVRLPRCMAY